MDMATIKANGAFYRSIFVISHGCVQLVCMVQALNNQCQCYPRRRLVPVNWCHTTSVWHLSSAAQLSFRVDKKIAQSMQTCCAGSFTKNVFTQNWIIVTLLKQKWTDVAKNLPTTYSMLSERTFHTISSWIWTILSLF